MSDKGLEYETQSYRGLSLSSPFKEMAAQNLLLSQDTLRWQRLRLPQDGGALKKKGRFRPHALDQQKYWP